MARRVRSKRSGPSAGAGSGTDPGVVVGTAPPGSPAPRRLVAPGWLNLRLVAGVLLVLISVVVGARVISAADDSDRVWAADRDLAAGTVLAEGDLRSVSVRLDEGAQSYVLVSNDPLGRRLGGSVRAGELLPSGLLADSSALVDIALPIAAGFVPPSLTRGRLVDIYALDQQQSQTVPADPEGTGGGTGTDGADVPDGGSTAVEVVVQGAVVQEISGRSDGALSVGAATVQVVISVPAEQAEEVFAAIGGRDLVLSVRTDITDGEDAATEDSDPEDTGPEGTDPDSEEPEPSGTPTN